MKEILIIVIFIGAWYLLQAYIPLEVTLLYFYTRTLDYAVEKTVVSEYFKVLGYVDRPVAVATIA